MIPTLDYNDIITYLKKNDSCTVSEDRHQDGLVELMLNRIVYALIPKMPNLTEDEVVDLVYELINDLESPFTFYVQCMAAEGVLEAIRVEDQSNGNSPISDYIVSVLGKDYRER